MPGECFSTAAAKESTPVSHTTRHAVLNRTIECKALGVECRAPVASWRGSVGGGAGSGSGSGAGGATAAATSAAR
jgi:hypothetical protein